MQSYTQIKPKPSGRCLIVEDSEFDRERLTRIINRSRNPMLVEFASTLKSARRALAENTISLILLDNNLPDGVGADFALELSDDPRLSNIPVIMVSDWPSPFMWEKAATAGVAYVLSKTEFDGRYIHAVMKAGNPAGRPISAPAF